MAHWAFSLFDLLVIHKMKDIYHLSNVANWVAESQCRVLGPVTSIWYLILAYAILQALGNSDVKYPSVFLKDSQGQAEGSLGQTHYLNRWFIIRKNLVLILRDFWDSRNMACKQKYWLGVSLLNSQNVTVEPFESLFAMLVALGKYLTSTGIKSREIKNIRNTIEWEIDRQKSMIQKNLGLDKCAVH